MVAFSLYIKLPLPPMHDELIPLMLFVIVLCSIAFFLAVLAPSYFFNPLLFGTIFYAGYHVTWVKVAKTYGYSLFGPQIVAGLFFALILIAFILTMNDASFFIRKRFSSRTKIC